MQTWPVGPLTVTDGQSTTFPLPAGNAAIAAAAVINMSALLLTASSGSGGPWLAFPGQSILIPFGAGPVTVMATTLTGNPSGPALVQYLDPDAAAVWTPQSATPAAAAAPQSAPVASSTSNSISLTPGQNKLIVPAPPTGYLNVCGTWSIATNLSGGSGQWGLSSPSGNVWLNTDAPDLATSTPPFSGPLVASISEEIDAFLSASGETGNLQVTLTYTVTPR